MYIETNKEKCMEQSLETEELYERIYDLKDKLYKLEDTQDKMIQDLLHSHITLGEMERIEMIF